MVAVLVHWVVVRSGCCKHIKVQCLLGVLFLSLQCLHSASCHTPGHSSHATFFVAYLTVVWLEISCSTRNQQGSWNSFLAQNCQDCTWDIWYQASNLRFHYMAGTLAIKLSSILLIKFCKLPVRVNLPSFVNGCPSHY